MPLLPLGVLVAANAFHFAVGSAPLYSIKPFDPQPASLAVDRRHSWCDLIIFGIEEPEPLHGRELSVVFVNDPRGFRVHTDAAGRVVGGYLVHVLDELARQGGFTWKGYIANATTETLDYEPHMLALAAKYDIIVDGIGVTPERRAKGLTFVWPIEDVSPVLVARVERHGPSINKILQSLGHFLRPFDNVTWLLFAASFLFTAIVYTIIEWPGDDLKDYTACCTHAMGQAMYLTFGSFTGGAGFSPTSHPGKLIASGWTFVMLLMTAAYTANLATLFVVQVQKTSDIKGFHDAVKRRVPICSFESAITTDLVKENYRGIYLQPGLRDVIAGGLEGMEGFQCDAVILSADWWESVKNIREFNPSCSFDLVSHSRVSARGSFAMMLDNDRCTYKLSFFLNIIMQKLDETGVIAAYRKTQVQALSQQDCSQPATQGGDNQALKIKDTAGMFAIVVLVGLVALLWHCLNCIIRCARGSAETGDGGSAEMDDSSDNEMSSTGADGGHKRRRGWTLRRR